jgi:hypothetical protein
MVRARTSFGFLHPAELFADEGMTTTTTMSDAAAIKQALIKF